MAANRRRLVHRLQAEDPLDLSALEKQAYLGRIGLARLGRPDNLGYFFERAARLRRPR
jgi:hypothetical protein